MEKRELGPGGGNMKDIYILMSLVAEIWVRNYGDVTAKHRPLRISEESVRTCDLLRTLMKSSC